MTQGSEKRVNKLFLSKLTREASDVGDIECSARLCIDGVQLIYEYMKAIKRKTQVVLRK